jgi:hypothetical protein
MIVLFIPQVVFNRGYYGEKGVTIFYLKIVFRQLRKSGRKQRLRIQIEQKIVP